MSVEIENASINSVQVLINVVKIGQKQMTQAVFNQLYEEKPWDDFYNITQFLWGKVNYKGTDYIVFQSENELRKYEIPKKVNVPGFMYYFIDRVRWSMNVPKLFLTSKRDDLDEEFKTSCHKVGKDLQHAQTRYGMVNFEVSDDLSLKDFETVMTPDFYENVLEQAKTKKWWDEKRNSLADELNSQKQLFIAV